MKIKLFEEFPYYLYKAVWDDDFQVGQYYSLNSNYDSLILSHSNLRTGQTDILGHHVVTVRKWRNSSNQLQHD